MALAKTIPDIPFVYETGSQAAIRSDFPFSWSSKKKGEKAKVGMMLYEIFKFVIPNAKYQRKRFTFKWRKFDQEMNPSHRYPYIYLFKVYRN